MAATHDVVVAGGGLVGLATALALTDGARRSIVLLEAEDRLAAHQSSHNSGVIHSGLYYAPDSLKAQTCREGREAMFQFCAAEASRTAAMASSSWPHGKRSWRRSRSWKRGAGQTGLRA